MADAVSFPDGGYRFAPGSFPFSSGVAAEDGIEIVHARFAQSPPVTEGFARIEAHLKSLGRPLTALCAAELRSKTPFTVQGFGDFNGTYVAVLEKWNIFRNGVNPVARSNVCPELGAPEQPSFYGFSYTVPAARGTRASFVLAGNAETDGSGSYPGNILRHGEVSADAMQEKARWVLGEMEHRLAVLGFSWQDVTTTQVYTVQDIHPFMASEIASRGAINAGLTWHFARPPVIGLEYEMDCRGVNREVLL